MADGQWLMVIGPFTAICGVGFLARLSYTMARSPVLPLFAATLTTSDRAVGFAAAASTITGIVFKLPAGALSDVVGRRVLLLASMIVFAGMPFAYLLVKGFTALLVIRFIHGLATALYGPVAMALVTDLAGQDKGARIAWFTTLTAIGSLIAPTLAGGIIDWRAGDRVLAERSDFMTVYFVAGFVGALAMLFAFAVLARSRPASPAAPRPDGLTGYAGRERRTLRASARRLRDGLREVFADRRVLVTSGAEAAIMLASNALAVFLALYVTDVLEQPKWFAGLLATVAVVSNLLVRPLMGRLGDRIGRRPLIIAGLVIASMPLVGIWMVRSPVLLVPIMAVFGLGESIVAAATAALVADVCKQRNYGAAMGTFGTIYDTGEASGPILVGALKDAFTHRVPEHLLYLAYLYAFAPVAVLLLAAALGFALLVREPERIIT